MPKIIRREMKDYGGEEIWLAVPFVIFAAVQVLAVVTVLLMRGVTQ